MGYVLALDNLAEFFGPGMHHLSRIEWESVCKCGSWWCEGCCERMGYRLRELLQERLASWRSVLMLTFTLDMKPYEGPLHAYTVARESKPFGHFIKAASRQGFLQSGEYFWVLEAHKSGAPHWHLLVPSRFIPIEFVSAWWGLGHVWVSSPGKFASTSHAINYATKYLLKMSQSGTPSWILASKGEVRRYGSSRGLVTRGALTGRKGRGKTLGRARASRKALKPISERIEVCGQVRNRVTQDVGIDNTGPAPKYYRRLERLPPPDYFNHGVF